ncbi:MAG TPA: RNase P subunit p30 family protein [Candidatus Methanoperedens sp.]
MSLFDTGFYDLVVCPKTHDSISGLAFEARRSGFCGIAVSNNSIDELNNVNKPPDFSIYPGIIISCKPSKFRDEIRKHKGKAAIMIARGKDEEFTRAAVETDGLDIILQPDKFNNVLAKTADDNSIAIGFNVGSIIRMRGEVRVRELKKMRTNLKHARKYGMQMVLTCECSSPYDFRSPREIVALSGLFGMEREEAVLALGENPLAILKRKSPGYIQEGIELV